MHPAGSVDTRDNSIDPSVGKNAGSQDEQDDDDKKKGTAEAVPFFIVSIFLCDSVPRS
jgi:hypothetical protein